jgi:hypothetical protein
MKLQKTPIVREFPNVFPKDLPSLPPKREIKLYIELTLGTVIVHKAPYQMALAKLKELKLQQQEFMDKGFILPSMSLWRAHLLFVKKKDGTMKMCEE